MRVVFRGYPLPLRSLSSAAHRRGGVLWRAFTSLTTGILMLFAIVTAILVASAYIVLTPAAAETHSFLVALRPSPASNGPFVRGIVVYTTTVFLDVLKLVILTTVTMSCGIIVIVLGVAGTDLAMIHSGFFCCSLSVRIVVVLEGSSKMLPLFGLIRLVPATIRQSLFRDWRC